MLGRPYTSPSKWLNAMFMRFGDSRQSANVFRVQLKESRQPVDTLKFGRASRNQFTDVLMVRLSVPCDQLQIHCQCFNSLIYQILFFFDSFLSLS